MPHFIITEVQPGPHGTIAACRVHPIMGGTEGAPNYRQDGGVWQSAVDVVALIDRKDAVFALNMRDGQRLPPERVRVDNGRLQSEALARLAREG